MLNRVYQNIEIKRQDLKRWWACCPFHNDTRPSMSIDKAGRYKDFYKCWSCGATGSPVRFAKLTGGKDFSGFERKKYNIKQTPEKPCRKSNVELALKHQKFYQHPDRQAIYQLAENLGIKSDVLKQFAVGYTGYAYSFPMYDEDNCLIGIRIRFADGRKRAIEGSQNGLFVPLPKFNPKYPIFITEGESDCMALYQMGFQVIGRPGNLQCKQMTGQWIKNMGFNEAIIIADNDEAGEKGAKDLADYLVFETGFAVKIIRPDKQHKDFREWFLNGVLREDIFEAIENADYVSPVRVKTLMNKIIIELGGKYEKR